MSRSFDYRQVSQDLRNFSQGLMSKEDFAAKYSYLLDEKTDLDKLQQLAKNPYNLSAWILKTMEGARNSVVRDKLTNKTVKMILENNMQGIEEEPEYLDLFDIDKYKTVVKYENEEGEEEEQVLYFQDANTVKAFIKNLLLSFSRIFKGLLEVEMEYWQSDLDNLREEIQQTKFLLEANPHEITKKSAERTHFDNEITRYIAQYFDKYRQVHEFFLSKTPEEVKKFLERITEKAWEMYLYDEYEKQKGVYNPSLYNSIGQKIIIDLVTKEKLFNLDLQKDLLFYDPNFVLQNSSSTENKEMTKKTEESEEPKQGETEKPVNSEYTAPSILSNNVTQKNKDLLVKSIFNSGNIPILG